jgi:hypothetical protein
MRSICSIVGLAFIAVGVFLVWQCERDARTLRATAPTWAADSASTEDERALQLETVLRIADHTRRVQRAAGIAIMAMGAPWFFYRSKQQERK